MGLGDICLYQDSFFPSSSSSLCSANNAQRTSVKCASKARSKQFSDKWLFLLRLIRCLLLLLKKGEQIRSTFVWLFRMRTRGICANMVEVHLCVQEVKTGHKQDLQLTRVTTKLCKSRRLLAKMLATLWQQIPYGCSKRELIDSFYYWCYGATVRLKIRADTTSLQTFSKSRKIIETQKVTLRATRRDLDLRSYVIIAFTNDGQSKKSAFTNDGQSKKKYKVEKLKILSFKEISWRVVQTGCFRLWSCLVAVSRQHILPILTNWIVCQPFGTMSPPPWAEPASHYLPTGSVGSPTDCLFLSIKTTFLFLHFTAIV